MQSFIDHFKKLDFKYVYREFSFHDNYYKTIDCNDSMHGGKRYYSTPDGRKYPSITTILSNSKSEDSKKALREWRSRVGEDEANRVTKYATTRGTKLHKLVENYIKKEKMDEPVSPLFKQIYPVLKRIDNIHGIETPLYSHTLKAAGRTDLIAEFDNELAVIDIKSSTKNKEEQWIEDYFLQTTAYACMFSENYLQRVKKVVLIIGSEASSQPQIFVREPMDYIERLHARIKKYYKEN